MKSSSKLLFLSTIIGKWGIAQLHKLLGEKKERPIHICFCMVDHYEPGFGNAPYEIESGRISELLENYPRIAERHNDSSGVSPKRTWFFPPHYHRNSNLKRLVSLCEKGYGEIELHLHHGKTHPDTSENLKNTILNCINEYSIFGIFGEQNGKKKYGFIHGDWALDNSRGGKYCGVNNELVILNETGCYADFTHPSMIETNPALINSIFYAQDNPFKPKSYKSGVRVKKNGKEWGDLMLIQGPNHPFFLSKKPWSLRAMGDAINGEPCVDRRRIKAWINTDIHVKGKNNIIFVKTHTHGATDSAAVLGQEMEYIFHFLESNYNDGKNYVLHYFTARELYNIIKAIESGECNDNPQIYRDYLISKPDYDSSPNIFEASKELKKLVERTYKE